MRVARTGEDLMGDVPALTAASLGSKFAPNGPNECTMGSFSSSLSEKFWAELKSLDCVSKLSSSLEPCLLTEVAAVSSVSGLLLSD